MMRVLRVFGLSCGLALTALGVQAAGPSQASASKQAQAETEAIISASDCKAEKLGAAIPCLLYTSPSPRDS